MPDNGLPEDDDFMGLARKRFASAYEDEKELRTEFVNDLRFASPGGEGQWDPQVKLQREQAGRPAMAFPRCHTFVQQVANEARQNKPQIKFAPALDADKETAEIYEGLARHIQYDSDAQIAYDTAVEYSAGGSFGYYRFLTEYADDDTDDQDLKVVPVLDPLMVYGILVPTCFHRAPKYAFVTVDIPKEEYKVLYPKTELDSIPWEEAERRGNGWVGSDYVRIAEYWWVTEGKGKRAKPKVKVCKINGFEILPDSETDWAGSSIPIVPVLGKQMIIEGKPKLYSVVRPQKAAQQLINYSKSRIAETLSTSPISPFMVAEGQINGYEKQWANLNTQQTPFLTYKVVDNSGREVPPPARQTFEPPIQSLSAFVAQEVDDMKATTGIFDASLGQNGNETSGQAIARRQQQGNLTTMHFMDNLSRSFRQGGDIIAEMIPLIYDSAREIHILGIDEAPKVVQINKEYQDETGQTKMHDMTKGKYKPIVTVGKAFDSKRMETFDTMQQVLATQPGLLNVIGDIFFANSDLAGADQLAERFKKMLPPQLQDNPSAVPPEAQAAMAQAHQQVQALQAELQKVMLERQGKVIEHQGKMQQIQTQAQADMSLEKMKLENALAIAEVETKAQNLNERMKAVEDMMSQFHSQAHDVAMQAAAAQQAQVMAQQQAASQSAQSAQDAAQQPAAPNGATPPQV
jgi:hypothetical protein